MQLAVTVNVENWNELIIQIRNITIVQASVVQVCVCVLWSIHQSVTNENGIASISWSVKLYSWTENALSQLHRQHCLQCTTINGKSYNYRVHSIFTHIPRPIGQWAPTASVHHKCIGHWQWTNFPSMLLCLPVEVDSRAFPETRHHSSMSAIICLEECSARAFRNWRHSIRTLLTALLPSIQARHG